MLASFIGASASAQQMERASARGVKALESVCDGAWLQVQATVTALSRVPKNALDRVGRDRVTCLLDAIGKTTFDADPQMNDVYTHSAVSTSSRPHRLLKLAKRESRHGIQRDICASGSDASVEAKS